MSYPVKTRTEPSWDWPADLWAKTESAKGRESYQAVLDKVVWAMGRRQQDGRYELPASVPIIESLLAYGDDLGCVTVDLREAIEAAKREGRWGMASRACGPCAKEHGVEAVTLNPSRHVWCEVCGVMEGEPIGVPPKQLIIYDVAPFAATQKV